MPEYEVLKVDGKKMTTSLRFFSDVSVYALFQIDNAKANQIPQIGATVYLDDVIRNPDYDYDYGVVTDITYSYDEDGALIDVMLSGRYLSGDGVCECEECYGEFFDNEDEEEDE